MKSTAKKLTLALTLSSTLACTSAFAQLPPATGCYATTSVDYYSLNEVSSSSMPYPGNLVESPTGGYSITTDYRSVTCTDAQGALRGTYPLQNNEQTKTHPVYFSDGSLGLSVREDDTGVSYMLFLNGDCTLRKKVSVDPVAGVPTIASDGTMVLGTNAGSIIFFNSDGTVAKKLDASSDRSFSYFGSPVLQDDDSISMLDTYGALHTVSADRSTVSDYSSSRGNILTPDTSVATLSDGSLVVGDSTGSVRILSKTDGSDLASYSSPDGAKLSKPIVLQDGSIFVGTSKGKAIIMDRKGNVKSTIDVGSRILKSSPRLLKSGNIAFGTADGSVHEVNAQGIEVAKFSPGAGIPQFITELKDGSLAVSSQPNTDGTGATLHMLQHSSTPTKTISKVTQVPCSVLQPGAAVDADAGVKKLDADKVKTPAGTGTDVPTMLPAK